MLKILTDIYVFTSLISLERMISTGGNNKRRDKLYIMYDIVGIAKEKTLKTQVMAKANLSFTQIQSYLKLMLKINLLQKVEEKDKELYMATDKGLEFLRKYGEINNLLKKNDEYANLKSPPTHLLP
jgi:predicted transcriptional regulator